MDLKKHIREIPDWPQKGVNFKDITTLLEDKEIFKYVIDEMCKPYKNRKIDKIVGIDARGFLLASAMAYKLDAGVSVVRKKGKLPYKTVARDYTLEYASETIEMHEDTIKPGEKVLIVDDLVATGGTLAATSELVEEMGGEIMGISFIVDLPFLGGSKKLKKYKLNYLVSYSAETEQKIPRAEIGVFGGSGFYDLLENPQAVEIETPFGKPSDKVMIGKIEGRRVAFIPRHGSSHKLPPHKIPYKANLWLMKKMGVKRIISPAAVGSLNSLVKPGDFVIADQFVNWTRSRQDTFYHGAGELEQAGSSQETGANLKRTGANVIKKSNRVAHFSLADPYCKELKKLAIKCSKDLKINYHQTGTVVVIDGPRFSSRAESKFFSSQGWDIINMTIYPEVALARELGMCYVNIGLVTDYDTGLEGSNIKPVNIKEVFKIFNKNNKLVKELIFRMIKNMPKEFKCDCDKFLDEAII